MQVSLNWLNDYIDLDGVSLETICTTLVNLGLEVETVEAFEPLKGPIVVGEILETEVHPDADKLKLCRVSTGEAEPLTIVCGGANARAGIKVAVAKNGAVLPGDFKIKSSKIRGQKSFGMLCGIDELGLGEADGGIWELDNGLELGRSIAELYKTNDTILTIGLTPNRPDCLGYIGIARDLGAKLGKPLKEPSAECPVADSHNTGDHIRVEIENEDDCGRFCALRVSGVKPVASPLWMKQRLEASGIRPINLIVDATNFVMLEYAQPNHAYDERDIKGGLIAVKRSGGDQKFATLDDKEHQLTAKDILIHDQEQAIGLAGIMGGQNSQVKDDTENVVIEVAHFNASLVRKTSKRLAIHTDSSHRFERGIDITRLDFIARRIASLIYKGLVETGSAAPEVASTMVDVYPSPQKPSRIALRLSRVKKILGLSLLTTDQCINHLTSIGFEFLDKKEDRMLFEVPSWRRDIEREVDLIEEVARLEGYDKLPRTLPMMEISPTPEDLFIDFSEKIKVATAETGFHEVISFPFTNQRELEWLNIEAGHPCSHAVKLANPLTEDQNLLHTSNVGNLLRAVAKNRRVGTTGAQLFEVARCFYRPEAKDGELSEPWAMLKKQGQHIKGKALSDVRPIERTRLGGILDHPCVVRSWDQKERPVNFFDAKGDLEKLLQGVGLRGLEFKPSDSRDFPWLNPTASARVLYRGHELGYLGETHPRTCQDFGLDYREAPFVFELDLEAVFECCLMPIETSQSISQFPAVSRDLAFVVDSGLSNADFSTEIAAFQSKNLSAFQLFDQYLGEGVPDGKKSLAYAFSFQSPKKTLTDKEVDKEIERLKAWLKKQLNAELR